MAIRRRGKDVLRLTLFVVAIVVSLRFSDRLFDVDNGSHKSKVRGAAQSKIQHTYPIAGEEKSFFYVPPSFFFILLAIQCGCQPVMVKLFMPTTLVRSTAVLAQEGVKLIVSLVYLASSNNWSGVTQGWTVKAAFIAAGMPAGLYVIQNYCNVMATQILPPITYIVLNQTKTLSTALCCFLLVGQKQSSLQVVALLLLILAALVIQKVIPLRSWCCGPENQVEIQSLKKNTEEEQEAMQEDDGSVGQRKTNPDTTTDDAARQMKLGVLPSLFASFLSGLAGTLAQRTLQESRRSPHLFNAELALFSSSFLLVSLAMGSPDYYKIKTNGVSTGWTWKTWIPVVTNALGAILVGLVTKYQGAVVKGFAMIFGMAISGVLQQTLFAGTGGGVTLEQVIGGCLGAFSLWMHINYQPTIQ